MSLHLAQPVPGLELFGDHGGGPDEQRAQGPAEVGGVVGRAAHHVDVVLGPPPQRHLSLHAPGPTRPVGQAAVHHALRPGGGARGVEHQLGAAAAVAARPGVGGVQRLLVVGPHRDRWDARGRPPPRRGRRPANDGRPPRPRRRRPGCRPARPPRRCQLTGRNGASSMEAAVATSKISMPLGSTAATGRPGPAPRRARTGGQAQRPFFQLTVGADDVAGDDGGTIRTLRGMARHPPHRTRGTFCHRRRDYFPRCRSAQGAGEGLGPGSEGETMRCSDASLSEGTSAVARASRRRRAVAWRGDRAWLTWRRPPPTRSTPWRPTRSGPRSPWCGRAVGSTTACCSPW